MPTGVLERAAVDRGRMVRGVGALGRERGWGSLSVARICERSGVPRRSFNTSFGSVEECCVAAIEVAIEQMWAATEQAAAAAGADRSDQVEAAVVGFLRFVERDPDAAWLCLVAPLGAGDRTRSARQDAIGRFGRLVGEKAAGAVGGLWELARLRLVDPDAIDVREIAGSSVFLALLGWLPREEAMRRAGRAAKQL